jgi:hypothetical protein
LGFQSCIACQMATYIFLMARTGYLLQPCEATSELECS